jgi:hypothetical protein
MGNIWNRHEAAQALMQSFADLMRSDLRSRTRRHALIPPPKLRIAVPLTLEQLLPTDPLATV